MWGLPPDAHVDGDVFLAGLHPEDRPRVEAAIARCTDPAGDGVYALEYRVVGIGDGVERWVATYGRTFFEDGRPAGFVGAALDVTGRKRAEARLRASEERFRQLADLAPAFIWFSDADGGVRHINDRWHDYTGQTPEEALDRGTVRAVHPEDVAPMLADWEEAARRGVPFENEFRCRRRDGAYR
jgi:PAS domain S-box-containing protein